MSFSGQDYNIISYGLDKDGIINYNDFVTKLYEYNPKIVIIGASSYSRIIDYKFFKNILDKYKEDKGECPIYFVDMAHVAGLVAAGVHPNPCDYADVVTSTTHKTLRGPRGGLILTNNEEYIKKINKAVFPGIQGGPLEHIIAAKGICFEEAMTDYFKEYGKQVIKNAKAFSDSFKELGWKIISGGTDNHMFILDVYNSTERKLTGKQAETALDEINITVNKNQIPNDSLPPLKSSGIRIGTPAMTTKGWKEKEFKDLAIIIDEYLKYCIKEELVDVTIINSYKEKVSSIIRRVNMREDNWN
jgi:glycine hydroxymethyltransferase